MDAKKRKSRKKSLHPPGGELLSAMQVPSDLAFGEPVVTFYGGREVQIENFRRILEYNACRLCVLTQYGRLLLVGEGIRIVCIPGRRCGWKGESIRRRFNKCNDSNHSNAEKGVCVCRGERFSGKAVCGFV